MAVLATVFLAVFFGPWLVAGLLPLGLLVFLALAP